LKNNSTNKKNVRHNLRNYKYNEHKTFYFPKYVDFFPLKKNDSNSLNHSSNEIPLISTLSFHPSVQKASKLSKALFGKGSTKFSDNAEELFSLSPFQKGGEVSCVGKRSNKIHNTEVLDCSIDVHSSLFSSKNIIGKDKLKLLMVGKMNQLTRGPKLLIDRKGNNIKITRHHMANELNFNHHQQQKDLDDEFFERPKPLKLQELECLSIDSNLGEPPLSIIEEKINFIENDSSFDRNMDGLDYSEHSSSCTLPKAYKMMTQMGENRKEVKVSVDRNPFAVDYNGSAPGSPQVSIRSARSSSVLTEVSFRSCGTSDSLAQFSISPRLTPETQRSLTNTPFSTQPHTFFSPITPSPKRSVASNLSLSPLSFKGKQKNLDVTNSPSLLSHQPTICSLGSITDRSTLTISSSMAELVTLSPPLDPSLIEYDLSCEQGWRGCNIHLYLSIYIYVCFFS
jgi:hypothetical protein